MMTLTRNPGPKVITQQCVAIDLDQAGVSVIESGMGVGSARIPTARVPVVTFCGASLYLPSRWNPLAVSQAI
jgi:hypothetical protein